MARSFAFAAALFHLALAQTYDIGLPSPTATVTTTTTTTALTTVTGPVKVSSTRLLPTTEPTSTTASFDLAHSLINQELFNLPLGDQDIPVKCVDCSTSGSLEVFVHNAEGNDTSFWFKRRKRDLDWDGPSGNLIASFPKGFEGHVELSLSSPKKLSHEFTLIEWPLLGVAVPGFGKAGVVASLIIPLDLELASEADLTFGFNFSLPRNASLNVHFPFVDESKSYGFTDSEGLKMDALPVELSIPGFDMTLTTGLRLELSVGVSASGDTFVVETGATLDLPQVVIEEKQLVNVDDACHASSRNLSTTPKLPTIATSNSTVSNGTSFNGGLTSMIGDYTHIEPSIGVNLTLFARLGAEVDIGLIDFDVDKEFEHNVFDKNWPLPTACIDNRPSTTTAPPTFSAATSVGGNGRAIQPTSSPASMSSALPSPANGGNRASSSSSSSSAIALLIAIAWAVLSP